MIQRLSNHLPPVLQGVRQSLQLEVEALDVFQEMHGARDWKQMVNRLIEQVENRKEPVIGLGHSFGGAMMVCAAASRPELFRKLIIVGICRKFCCTALRLMS